MRLNSFLLIQDMNEQEADNSQQQTGAGMQLHIPPRVAQIILLHFTRDHSGQTIRMTGMLTAITRISRGSPMRQ